MEPNDKNGFRQDAGEFARGVFQKAIDCEDGDRLHIMAAADLTRLQEALLDIALGVYEDESTNKNLFMKTFMERLIRADYAIEVLKQYYGYDYCEDIKDKYVAMMDKVLDETLSARRMVAMMTDEQQEPRSKSE